MKTAFRFCLRLRHLSSAYDLVKTRLSESEAKKRRTKPITKRGNVHCDWFIFLLLLPTLIWLSLDHKQNINGGVVSEVGRNGNVLILLTLILSHLWYPHIKISPYTELTSGKSIPLPCIQQKWEEEYHIKSNKFKEDRWQIVVATWTPDECIKRSQMYQLASKYSETCIKRTPSGNAVVSA